MVETKRKRHQEILYLVARRDVSTQQELASLLARRGIRTTQSSLSRDIVEIGLTKINGHYVVAEETLRAAGPVVSLDTAGDNIIVVKTEIGQAQPAALTIDNAEIDEIVGTVAGDDTILVAVKNSAAQRVALKKILRLFSRRTRHATRRPAAERPAAAAPHRRF